VYSNTGIKNSIDATLARMHIRSTKYCFFSPRRVIIDMQDQHVNIGNFLSVFIPFPLARFFHLG